LDGNSIAGGTLFCSTELIDDSTVEVTTLNMADGRPRSSIQMDRAQEMLFAQNGQVIAITYDRTQRLGAVGRWLHNHVPFLKLSDRELKLVDAPSGKTVAVISGGRHVMWGPDGHTLAVIGEDNICRLWDIPPRKPLTWFALAAAVLALPLAGLAWRRVRLIAAP
jgi:WD40 repeat protein